MPQTARRPAPQADLVNVLDYEAEARLVLDPPAFARVAGGDRSGFDRITLRPRMLVPTVDLELGLTLFGHRLHSPILVGPIDPGVLGREALASDIAAGAAAAHAPVIATALSPARETGDVGSGPFGLQVFATDSDAAERAGRAAAAGCRVLCVTVGTSRRANEIRRAAVRTADWRAVGTLVRDAGLPVMVKGITSVADAGRAIEHGAAGLVFSNDGGLFGGSESASILDLPTIVDAVGGKVPVLMDGGFRRGTDIVKALAFGATAVLVARPVVWGAVVYGASGVQGVLEMLQTELARYMAMCGKPSLASLDRTLVRIHAR